MRFLLVLLSVLCFCEVTESQNTLKCTKRLPQAPAQPRPAQPAACVDFFKDLVPTSSENVIEVKVKFWIFKPTTGIGAWDNNTNSRAVNALRQIDSTFANLSINTLSVAGNVVLPVSNAKIKFILDGNVNIVADNSAYFYTPSAEQGSVYNSPNAINVYYGAMYPDGPGYWNVAFVDPPLPNNHVHFPTGQIGANPQQQDIGDADNAYKLTHEISHALGLAEAVFDTNYVCNNASEISSSFGCCSNICTDDYVLEVPFHAGCGAPGGSNNIMSANIGCHQYLSPQQIAVMHYNLRTKLVKTLSGSGFINATTRTPSADYIVNANETWTYDRYFKGHIIVKANKTLTIKCGVAMTFNSSIIVEPGAQLIIDGGHVTNISGRFWDGIKVLGNPNQSQTATNPNNPGALLHQGLVRLKNGAKLSNALVAVQNYYGTSLNSSGVIFAQNSTFLNNKWDIKLESTLYQAPKTNASWIYNCNFETNNFLNDPASPNPVDHIYLNRVKGIAIKGCTFQCLPSHFSPGNGIKSVDASYVLQETGNNPNLFKNLARGVLVNNINPLSVPNISGCIFENNQQYAAYFMNAHYLAFTSNTVIVDQSTTSEGVYLNNSRFYTIKGNTFTKSGSALTSSGLLIYKSQAGAHSVYKNNFSKLRVGINCMDNNSGQSNIIDGLQMNCNKFNSGTYNDYDVALTFTSGMSAPTVMQKQGENNPLNQTPAKLVRNIYGAVCGNENKWYIHSQSTKQILHGSNTNSVVAVTQPTPQTGSTNCSRPLLSIANSSINLDYPNHCPLNPPSSGGSSTVQSQRLANMNDYLSGLKANGNEDDYFEIEATLGNKLNIFLSDSLDNNHGLDSAMAIYANNQQYLPDTKTMEFFGYLLKGELAEAYTKANTIKNTDSELGELLLKVKQLAEDTLGFFRIKEDAGLLAFFENYATNPEISGHSIAQAALFAATGQGYTEPVAYPEAGSGARPSQQSEDLLSKGIFENDVRTLSISVFPNPAESQISVAIGEDSGKQLLYTITDLTGKVIINGNLKTGVNNITIASLSNGMYFLNVKNDSTLMCNQKFVVAKN